jgi:predicted transcriptional regulator of viral defense system
MGAQDQAIDRFRAAGGILRASKTREMGIHPRTLRALKDEGRIEQLSRGLYRLTELPSLSDPDLVTVALSVPQGVVCLISALHFHTLTTEIPREVMLALPRGAKEPRLAHPPIRVFRFSAKPFEDGVETHRIDDVEARIYSPAKTVADAFKFRNVLGTPVAVEALQTGLEEGRFRPPELLRHACVCRVERLMMPYLEALL